MKQFKLVKPDTNEDVLGGAVGEDNVYIKTYGVNVNKDDKVPSQLEVGESVLRRFAISGTTGIYRVVRLEDSP